MIANEDRIPARTEVAEHVSDATLVRVDRTRAITISGRDAAKFAGQLADATKTGFSIGSRVVSGDLYELVPSDELKKGLRDKTLKYASPKRGDASVIVHRVKDGKFAGKADLKKVGTPMKAVAGAGLSAVSFAVEQQQLAEIAKRLDQIEQTADEARKLLKDDRAAAARTARRAIADAHSAYEAAGRVPEELLTDLHNARELVEQAMDKGLETVERHLQEYADDKLSGKQAEKWLREDFVFLANTVNALAQTNAALVSLPYSSSKDLDDAILVARTKLARASDSVGKAVIECLRLNDARAEDVRLFRERLRENGWGRLPDWMHWTLLEAPNGITSWEGIKSVRPWAKPKKPLPEATLDLLREPRSGPVEPMPLLVEVIDDDRLLVGPADTVGQRLRPRAERQAGDLAH